MVAAETPCKEHTSAKKRLNRILVVEDSPAQAYQIAGILESEQRAVEVALDAERGLSLFLTTDFDLVITDVMLPGMSGYDLCEQIKCHASKGDVPVILVTSLSDPTNIIKGLACGANNFITKPYSAENLLNRVCTILDRKNRRGGKHKGSVEVVFQGQPLIVKSDKEQILDLLLATFEDFVRTNQELQTSKTELASAKRQVDEYARRLESRVRTTEEKRNQAEQALVESERRHRRLVEFSPDAMFINRANTIVFANKPCLKLFGAETPEQVLGKSVFEFIHPDYHAIAKEHVLLMESGKPVPLREEKIIRLNGTAVDVEVSASPYLEDGVPVIQVVCRDISDRKKLEEQFHQAQKMEAVGKLAGGVAHDFNNLLTVISGYSDILLTLLPVDDSRKTYLHEIQKAVERAVHLTRQLLAFSRKAVVEPRVLDLNALVNGTEKMLRRLIGEDVRLTATLAPTISKIKADAGQVEQVIVNLAVNARDAMPQGGKLTIETSNVELGSGYVDMHPEVRAGLYVMLKVSDTGMGMTQETKAHIFEPFFTTKETGKGTGLGLATVYGIVTQGGGHIEVDTGVGQGASFRIYFPAVNDNLPSRKSQPGVPVVAHGKETILLVEDEEAVRNIAKLTLQSFNYNVLAAENGKEAIRLCEQFTDPIHLVITDVVMPEMGGRQVAERLTACRPGIKILFISGYTDDAVVRHGISQAEVAFLQKPFTPMVLAAKVREVLDQ
jgi:PAS domain S-box-containing protein